MDLYVSDPVIRCYVDFCSLALSAHALREGNLVVTVSNGDPDGLCVCEVAHRNIVKIYAESYCHAKGIAHTVELEHAVFRKNERGAALLAGRSASLDVYYIAARRALDSE